MLHFHQSEAGLHQLQQVMHRWLGQIVKRGQGFGGQVQRGNITSVSQKSQCMLGSIQRWCLSS